MYTTKIFRWSEIVQLLQQVWSVYYERCQSSTIISLNGINFYILGVCFWRKFLVVFKTLQSLFESRVCTVNTKPLEGSRIVKTLSLRMPPADCWTAMQWFHLRFVFLWHCFVITFVFCAKNKFNPFIHCAAAPFRYHPSRQFS